MTIHSISINCKGLFGSAFATVCLAFFSCSVLSLSTKRGITLNQPPHDPHGPDAAPRDIGWFLRRELLTLPLAAVVVLVLLVFNITPATLLFVALLTVLTFGWLWGGRT